MQLRERRSRGLRHAISTLTAMSSGRPRTIASDHPARSGTARRGAYELGRRWLRPEPGQRHDDQTPRSDRYADLGVPSFSNFRRAGQPSSQAHRTSVRQPHRTAGSRGQRNDPGAAGVGPTRSDDQAGASGGRPPSGGGTRAGAHQRRLPTAEMPPRPPHSTPRPPHSTPSLLILRPPRTCSLVSRLISVTAVRDLDSEFRVPSHCRDLRLTEGDHTMTPRV